MRCTHTAHSIPTRCEFKLCNVNEIKLILGSKGLSLCFKTMLHWRKIMSKIRCGSSVEPGKEDFNNLRLEI